MQKRLDIFSQKTSGFHLVTDRWQLLIDYYGGPLTLTEAPLYVFATHGHPDHYSEAIFDLKAPSITYVLSDDIVPPAGIPVTQVRPGDVLTVGPFAVRVYSSTDLGVSYRLSVDGWELLHLGDLNWWHWEEDTLEQQRAEEHDFKSEIRRIAEDGPIDIAFVPVDPRLGDAGFWAGDYVIQALCPRYLVPMHLQEEWSFAGLFKERQKLAETVVLPTPDAYSSWILLESE